MAPSFQNPKITVLGNDPPTKFRMNCNSFQQSGIVSLKGYQYAVFYTDASELSSGSESTDAGTGARHVNITRRRLTCPPGKWEVITLLDYDQTTDDGHNTISMGLCEGDGTIHLAFDVHCEGLKYKVSKPGMASEPGRVRWNVEVGFSAVLGVLPMLEGEIGMREMEEVFEEITYPRFLSVDRGELLCEWRVGMAGEGSCVLFRYAPDGEGRWRWVFVGKYLVGERCNPYINGLSWESGKEAEEGTEGMPGKIHVSWTNRHFVEYQDESGEAHKQHAGPNGPENNADLGYLWSDDGGQMWRNGQGRVVADLMRDRMTCGALSTMEEIMMTRIPRDSGIINQESQCVNLKDGSFHVLTRDTSLTGKCRWRHSWRTAEGEVMCSVIEETVATETGSRGSIGADGTDGSVYFVLPGNEDNSLVVGRKRLKGVDRGEYEEFEIVWKGDGYDGEPLIDEALLKDGGGLGVMTRTAGERRKVVVLDFELGGME